MANQSMISDTRWVPRPTVIEVARRAAGMSQRRLADIARTQQSSVSEYERRRKSPTLDVVERLVGAANHELVAKPLVFWDYREDSDPDVRGFLVPDLLWQVPVPDCYARVTVFYFRAIVGYDVWDLSVREDRIEFYQLALAHGTEEILLHAVDGALLVEAWPELKLPEAVRDAWQPLIDGAKGPRSAKDLPLDPGGFSARLAADMNMAWPMPTKSRPRSEVEEDAGGG
jgi:transcriptional regulator with XRE-family HTH domain